MPPKDDFPPPVHAPTISLRGGIWAAATIGFAYVLGIAIYMAWQVQGTAEELDTDTEAMSVAFRRVLDRFNDLEEARAIVASALDGPASMPRDTRARVEAFLGGRPGQEHLSQAVTAPDLSSSLRIALGQAADVESIIEVELVSAAAALDVGNLSRAREAMARADSLHHVLHSTLAEAQVLGVERIDERQEALLSRASGVRTAVFWWLGVGLLILAVGGWFGRRWLFVPLRELDVGLFRLNEGDYTFRLPVRRQDELGRLASHFNTVADSLEKAAALTAQEQLTLRHRLANILHESFDEIFIFYADSLQLIQASQGAVDKLGLPWDEVMRLRMPDLLEDLDEAGLRSLLEPLASGRSETRVLRLLLASAEGAARPAEVRFQYSGHETPPVYVAVARDRTEDEAREAELVRSQLHLKRAQRVGGMGSWEMDTADGSLAWSEEVYRMFGVSPEDFEPSFDAFLATVHPDDRKGLEEKQARALASGRPLDVEHRIVLPDGRIREVHERAEVEGTDGAGVRLLGTVRDITDEKETKRRLEEAHRIVSESPAALFLWRNEPGWPVEFATPNVETLFGYSREDFQSGSISYADLVHPDDLARVIGEFDELPTLDTETYAHRPYRILHRNGAVRWMDDRTLIRRDAKGRVTHAQGIVLDITDAMEKEEELQRSQERLRLALRAGGQGLYDVDLAAGVVTTNEEYRVLTAGGTRPESWDGWRARIHPDDRARVEAQLRACARGERDEFRSEFRIRRDDDVWIWVLSLAQVVARSQTGEARRLLGTHTDITPLKEAQAEAERTNQILQGFLDHAPAIMYVKDVLGRHVLINREFEALTGLSPDDASGRTNEEIFPPDVAARLSRADARVLSGGVSLTLEEETEGMAFLSSKFPIADSEGRVLLLGGISIDVTEQREVQRRIARQERFMSVVLENVSDAVVACDDQGTLSLFNRAARDLHQRDLEEMDLAAAMEASGLLLPDGTPLPEAEAPLARAFAGEAVRDVEIMVEAATGVRRHVLASGQPLIDEGGGKLGAVVTMRDVTEQMRSERELRESFRRLHSVREDERRQVARELHDELGGSLTGIKIGLAMVRRILPTDPDEGAARVAALMGEVDDTIARGRSLAVRLRPGVLDEVGLLAAIDWLARDFSSRTGLPCHAICDVESLDLDDEGEAHVFRICQEALTNVARHAQAREATVIVEARGPWGRLTVRDDGRGFDLAAVDSGRLGVRGMRERAQILGGTFGVESVPGSGTSVLLDFPLRRTVAPRS